MRGLRGMRGDAPGGSGRLSARRQTVLYGMRAGSADRGRDLPGRAAAGEPKKRSNNGKITRKTAVF